MKLVIEGASYVTLSNWIKAVKCVAEEVVMIFTPLGAHILTMDPSHVAMIDAKIAAKAFKEYTADEEESISFNANEFMRFLDRLDKKQKVTISYAVDKAKFIIKGEYKGRTRRFELPTLEPFDAEVPQPKINFTGTAKMALDAFITSAKDVALVSEHIKVEFTEKLIKMNGQGDIGDAFNDWDPTDSDDIISHKIEEDSSATFTLSYINDILLALKNATDKVEVSMSTDMPIKIEAHGPPVEIDEGTLDKTPDPQNMWDLTYYLAPCIGV